ncbi:hypothetical protein OSTOST_24710, partial [Ostertagia ostertagi]
LGRRSGKASLLDAATVLQFLLYECAALGDVFFVVLTAMSCWITFAYKSQTYPFYTILNGATEWVLMAYLIATACLKFIALIHNILHMILQETFFIDWERPQIIEVDCLLHGSILKSHCLHLEHTASSASISRCIQRPQKGASGRV